MREIEFGEGRLYSTTIYATDCLAWATNRRGHNSWKGTNVIDDIFAYLVKHNVDLVVPHANGTGATDISITTLKRTAKLMVELGFATLTTHGKRYTYFEFKPDVILTGHTVRFKGVPVVTESKEPKQPRAVELDLPLPAVTQPVYRLDEINKLLTKFSEVNVEAYAEYADKLCSVLEVVLDE